jgi:very-short-patch-repair endonuclease
MRLYDDQPAGTVTRARDLRRNATEAETRLWRALREAFPNARFRRQVPVGRYFADLLSVRTKLIVEVDGGQHAQAADYDATRTRFLETQGYRVLRFWNNDVLANTDGVIAHISFSLGEKEGAPKARKDEGERAQEKGTPA